MSDLASARAVRRAAWSVGGGVQIPFIPESESWLRAAADLGHAASQLGCFSHGPSPNENQTMQYE